MTKAAHVLPTKVHNERSTGEWAAPAADDSCTGLQGLLEALRAHSPNQVCLTVTQPCKLL